MKKIIRACTVSMSLGFVSGMLPDLTKKYEVVLLSSPGPEMDEAREQYGVRTIEVPMERHISPVKDFLSLCRLIRVFLRERPDMVHSMTPKAGLLCMAAAWLTRVPVRIHTFTGLVWPTSTGLKRRILMLTDAITCWCATHVIPEGEGVKADLLNNGITRKPLRILGYGNVRGIDMQRFKKTTDDSDNTDIAHSEKTNTNCTNFASKREQCQTCLSIAEREQSQDRDSGINTTNDNLTHVERDKTTDDTDSHGNLKTKNQKLKTKNSFEFLFVGRIVGDKGINELVEAFCRLNSEKPETRLVLVGFYEQNLDPVSEETHRMIEENPNIIMAGERTGDDLVRSYAEADCFVFPSYREGFPNTVLEAGAMGLPCIVTDINGSREIITDIAHADLADHADNLYFDHGSTRIHTDDNLTHTAITEKRETTDDTDSHGFLDEHESHEFSKNKKLRTKTNGIIIPPRDAEALYEAMKLMVTDDGMREAMARNARPMIESRFEQGFVRKCLYDFYEDILDS